MHATRRIKKGTVYIFEDSACLLCIDRGDRIVLVRQFREPLARETLELPGGNIQQGESALEAALREFEEETALPKPSTASLLFSLDLDLSTSIHRTHVFRARLDQDVDPASQDLPLIVLTKDDAIQAVRTGSISHAPTVAAILSEALA